MQGNPFADDVGDGFKKEVLIALEMLHITIVNKDNVNEEDRADAKEEKLARIKAAEEAAEEARIAAELAEKGGEKGEDEDDD